MILVMVVGLEEKQDGDRIMDGVEGEAVRRFLYMDRGVMVFVILAVDGDWSHSPLTSQRLQ